jgi:hypothetical protein
MVLKILRWFGILVLLGVLALVTLPLLPVAKDRLSAGPVQDYINEYACALHIGNDATRFVLPASVADARFVMLSEMHGFAGVQAIDLMMVRKMAEERGTRIYLAELSPDQAIAFNAMVLDGDDSFALEVFEFWSGITAQWGNREFFAKLEALRDFNRGRPPAENAKAGRSPGRRALRRRPHTTHRAPPDDSGLRRLRTLAVTPFAVSAWVTCVLTACPIEGNPTARFAAEGNEERGLGNPARRVRQRGGPCPMAAGAGTSVYTSNPATDVHRKSGHHAGDSSLKYTPYGKR